MSFFCKKVRISLELKKLKTNKLSCERTNRTARSEFTFHPNNERDRNLKRTSPDYVNLQPSMNSQIMSIYNFRTTYKLLMNGV